jgi:hypothetical protein
MKVKNDEHPKYIKVNKIIHRTRQSRAGDLFVEAVGKVPEQFFAGDAQKSGLLNGSTIDDLILGKGKKTPGK